MPVKWREVGISLGELVGFDDEPAALNLKADANGALPLIPPGIVPVKSEFLEKTYDKIWTTKKALIGRRQHRYLAGLLIVEVLEGPFRGRTVSAQITTLRTTRSACSANKFAVAVGFPPEPRSSETVRYLTAGANQPWICIAQIDWMAVYWDADQNRLVRVRGMHRFPKNPDGSHNPMFTTPQGDEYRAFNVVRGWKPIGA